jgi:hypothetical protein
MYIIYSRQVNFTGTKSKALKLSPKALLAECRAMLNTAPYQKLQRKVINTALYYTEVKQGIKIGTEVLNL